MKQMQEAKQRYDDIPIPAELAERVRLELKRRERKRIFARGKRAAVAAAAALAILFGVGLNTSETFARGMYEVPFIGALARVLTVRSYETRAEDLEISVEIPGVEMIAEDLKGTERSVNEEIHAFCEQYAQEARERAEAYRQAFLDTGGTKEEWEEHGITIRVWYEVKTQTDRYLSIAVTGEESWNSAYGETRFYNFDMDAGRWLTLRDVLGEEYAQIADRSILEQIRSAERKDGMEYQTEGWEGVSEDTKFYLNQNGNPIVVLEKYEIAPGAAGALEFEIGKTDDAAEHPARDGYEDNFDVDEQAAAAFAEKIKEAVAQKDAAKLADLTNFPVYVGLPGENQIVQTREEFMAIGERLFPEELEDSLAKADQNDLSPSMAGFTLCGGAGSASITFGVVDGKLGIVGINY